MLNECTTPPAPVATIPLIDALRDRVQFIVYKLVPGENGRTEKIPVHPETLRNIDAHDSANWLRGDRATQYADYLNAFSGSRAYGVGIVLFQDCGIAAIDIDHALVEGKWSPLAEALCARFSGAYIEVSPSGTGLHIFFAAREIPPHKKKNVALAIEFYSELRFLTVTGTNAIGNVLHDATDLLPQLIADYFQPSASADNAEWTEAPLWPVPGTSDDVELIRKMRAVRSPGATFGSKASTDDLWTGNVDALAKAFPPSSLGKYYDASSADQALANHLIWWTGGDCARTERLMRESALKREKWDYRADYLTDTICDALAFTAKNPPKEKVSAGTEPLRTTADGVPLPPDAMPVADSYLSRVDLTDKGNANLLIQLAGGNLRYVAETKQWLRWDGRRWQMDEHEVFVTGFAVEVARYYLLKAQKLDATGQAAGQGHELLRAEDFFKWAAKCRGKGAIDNMIALARKSEGVPISVTALDQKPHLLGVENGVVDLRTGELRESEAREDYVTKRSPVRYNPAATAPRWESLIVEATGSPVSAERDAEGHVILSTVGRFTPRPALASYIHKALGYSTTGETREQKLFVEIGEGSNGKGLIGEQVKAILGPYAVVLPAEALMATKHGADSERPTALAASLAGARFVVASESKVGQKLDVALIKAHTGDEEMTARRMRENPFTFKITHKLWLLTNVRPMIDHIDAAFKGRLHLVPFDRRWNRPGEFERDPSLPEGDKGMKALLVAESEGVLAWLVRGAVLYYQEGLTPPAEVIEKTREYVLEQDHFARWLAVAVQRCLPKLGTMAAELLNHFIGWCANDGADPQPYSNKTAFGRALGSRGIESIDIAQGRKWGLRANTTSDTTNTTPIPPPPERMP